jgi:chitinase
MANRKAAYIQRNSLGGAMWWELSGDKPDGPDSIITNVSLCFVALRQAVAQY